MPSSDSSMRSGSIAGSSPTSICRRELITDFSVEALQALSPQGQGFWPQRRGNDYYKQSKLKVIWLAVVDMQLARIIGIMLADALLAIIITIANGY